MDVNNSLTSIKNVKKILNELGHKPNKALGQNYLIDLNIINFIIRSSEINKDEEVLEIGPGLGVLTEQILLITGRLICIEKDKLMIKYLKSRFKSLNLIKDDVLKYDLDIIFKKGVNKVISNLPYSISSRLIVNISESNYRPKKMYLTIQREVAERLVAKPGDKDYGVITILTNIFYKKKILKHISSKCFFPSPKVSSSIIEFKKLKQPLLKEDNYLKMKRIVKYCFSQRRKQLQKSLKNLGLINAEKILNKSNIPISIRPENISTKQWIKICHNICIMEL